MIATEIKTLEVEGIPAYTNLVSQFDAFIFDLDGVCFAGDTGVVHAAESIKEIQKYSVGIAFMTNNAMRAPQSVIKKLNKVGITGKISQVVTCAQVAAGVIREKYPVGTKVIAVGGEGVIEALKEVDLTPVYTADDKPLVVMQGLAKDIGWSQLSEAAIAIENGAEYIATNIDSTLPTERGKALGNGSLVAAVINATGVVPQYCGKPGKIIYQFAQHSQNSSNPCCVGDRLDTDITGAVELGFGALHVITGVNNEVDVFCAPSESRPNILARDLRDLYSVHQPVFLTSLYCPSVNDVEDKTQAVPGSIAWLFSCDNKGFILTKDDIYKVNPDECIGIFEICLEDGKKDFVNELDKILSDTVTLREMSNLDLDLSSYRALAAAFWFAQDQGLFSVRNYCENISFIL